MERGEPQDYTLPRWLAFLLDIGLGGLLLLLYAGTIVGMIGLVVGWVVSQLV